MVEIGRGLGEWVSGSRKRRTVQPWTTVAFSLNGSSVLVGADRSPLSFPSKMADLEPEQVR
jgi:hypothetical protein